MPADPHPGRARLRFWLLALGLFLAELWPVWLALIALEWYR